MIHKRKFHHMRLGGSFVFLLAFLLNFVWESVHAVLLYEGHAGYTASFFMRMILYASSIDALLVLGIFCIGSLLFKDDYWLENYGSKGIWFTIILGIFIAAIIETKALLLGQWKYTAMMPTLFGIGLSPLVQLAITGSLSIFFTAKLLYSNLLK